MTFKRRSDYDARCRSIHEVVEFVLRTPLHSHCKKKLLNCCLWQLTVAEGTNKYNVRFVSAAAKLLLTDKGRSKVLRHDHVFRRAQMVEKLMRAKPQDAASILRRAVGCVVTKEEHDKNLRRIDQLKDADGWERYKRAQIVVWDQEKASEANLEELIAASRLL
jgi:hypothetical protein